MSPLCKIMFISILTIVALQAKELEDDFNHNITIKMGVLGDYQKTPIKLFFENRDNNKVRIELSWESGCDLKLKRTHYNQKYLHPKFEKLRKMRELKKRETPPHINVTYEFSSDKFFFKVANESLDARNLVIKIKSTFKMEKIKWKFYLGKKSLEKELLKLDEGKKYNSITLPYYPLSFSTTYPEGSDVVEKTVAKTSEKEEWQLIIEDKTTIKTNDFAIISIDL